MKSSLGRPDRRAHHRPVLPRLPYPVRQVGPGRRQHRGRREDLRPEPPGQRPGWFSRLRDAHARLDQTADALDRLVQRQATGPGQILDRTGAVNRARDGPLLPAEYGRNRAEIAQPDWRGAGQLEARHPFGLLDHLGEHEVDAQAGERARPVLISTGRAGRGEPDVGDERVPVRGQHQHQGSVHHDRAQDGLQVAAAEVVPLHQHGADIAVRPVRARDQLPRGGREPERAEQARAQVRDPGRLGEGDLPVVQVDGPGRVPVDLHDSGDPPLGQPLQGRGDPRPGWLIGSGQHSSHPRPGRAQRKRHK